MTFRGRLVSRALGVGVSAAVATVGLVSPSQAAPGDGQFRELTGPVLAPDDRGGHFLVARRDIDGTHLQGQVVTSRLAPGARKWTAARPLSSQKRTVGLSLDAAGAGHALAAWTAGGHVYLRSRSARGVWSPETKLSRQSGTRWVDVDVNRAGDQAVTWLQGGHPMLAWRAAGETSWKRWRGPKSTLRPAADLGERKSGRSTARITWLNGAEATTSVRLREFSVAGRKKPATTKVLMARADITDFAWDAGANRMTLALINEIGDDGCGYPKEPLTIHAGPLVGGTLTEVFAPDSRGQYFGPAVDATGTAALVTWGGHDISANCSDDYYGQSGAIGQGRTWKEEGADPGWSAGRIAASGRGLTAVVGDYHAITVRRLGGTSRLLLQRRGDVLFGPDGPIHGGPSVSVGSKGRFAAAWAEGPRNHPVLKVRTFSR